MYIGHWLRERLASRSGPVGPVRDP